MFVLCLFELHLDLCVTIFDGLQLARDAWTRMARMSLPMKLPVWLLAVLQLCCQVELELTALLQLHL